MWAWDKRGYKMNYKLKIWNHDETTWGWSIMDYVGDEVASSDEPFENREDARQDGRCALSDWNPENE